jgi:ribosomal protein S18 acetylase RimI-like enzyme
MDNIIIEKITKSKLIMIKPLWEELNQIHEEKSIHFKDCYAVNSFERRMKLISELDDEFLLIEIVMSSNKPKENIIGYCISSRRGNDGEVDSIYIDKSYRGADIGSTLMRNSMAWFSNHGCKNIFLKVAEGNEDVFCFYEKFGFEKRLTYLQRR